MLLGVSGQLERYRWIARIAALIGACFFVMCWATDWIVPGVQLLPSGMFYLDAGPLTGLARVAARDLARRSGSCIARRASPRGERKRTMQHPARRPRRSARSARSTRCCCIAIWGVYPIAWLPASVAAVVALYLVLRTDLLRPQGFDRDVAIELGVFLAIGGVIGGLVAAARHGATRVAAGHAVGDRRGRC